ATIIRSANERGRHVLQYDFDESVGYWLCTAATAMQDALNQELAQHGITYRQFQVLAWLSHAGEELTQADLAARMRIEPPTLVGLLDRMEQQGWITRVGCPGDRRKKLVRPAPAAEEVWERMVEILTRVRARATARLTPEQVDSLREILRTMHETLTATAPQPAVTQS
ncbi:MAG TPA: MarR family transcriptional regulator, partial [Planctomycetaceae bacterium]